MRIFIMLLFLSFSVVAQDFDDYQLLKNEGNLPEDFITSSAVKYEKEIADLDKTLKRKDKKDQEQFFLESNYTIDDLLLSGQVFYNNEVTRYVNKVADKILKDDPTFRKQLRIYVVRSSSVNAFATNQGIILVNMGLLAQLENEAQLAYILCHEMIHVKHAHALDMFLEAKDIDKYTQKEQLLKKTNSIESNALVAKNHYSKELETEADDKGLDLYLKTDYSLEALDGVFDVLQYSYLPFDEVPFDTAFFNNDFITIPTEYFLDLDDINPIEAPTNDDDEKNTHPSVVTRRMSIEKRITNLKNDNKKEFILSKSTFEKVQKIARYELVAYYLRSFRLQDAIYATYLLMKVDPNSKYLKISLAKALYNFAKLKDEYSALEIEDARSIFGKKAYKDVQGQSQQIYHLFAKIEAEELIVMTLRYLWDLKQEYPKNTELKTMLKDMFRELINSYEELSEFSTKSLAKITKDTVETVEKQDTSQKLSKYDKIKKQKRIEKIEEPDFGTYAFWDVINDAAFREEFIAAHKRKEKDAEWTNYYQSAEGQKYLKRKRKRGSSLGIDSVLVVNPYFVRLEKKGEDTKTQYKASESKQQQFSKFLKSNAKIVKLDLQILDVDQLESKDNELFYQIQHLGDWVRTEINLGLAVFVPAFNQAQVEEIMERYGTQYLMITGVISLKKRKEFTLYYAIIFDVKTRGYELLKYDFFKQNANPTLLNSQIYDTLFQIKRKYKK